MGDLFQRVQDTIKGSINNGGNTIPFCSRSTRVTTINGSSPVNPQDIVSYVDCDGKTKTVPYIGIFTNGGYINDCVQGGCSIKSTGESQLSNRYFVQFGTTNCNANNNLLFTECNSGKNYVVPSTDFGFRIGTIYDMTLGSGTQSCFTYNGTTISDSFNTISVVNGSVRDCALCKTPSPSSFPTQTLMTPTPTPMIISYIVGDTSYEFQQEACASSGGGTITVYSNSPLVLNSTFLYTDSGLTTPYYSNGFVFYSGKGNYVIGTGFDGKLTSVAPCT
jgi:hypothetical protein